MVLINRLELWLVGRILCGIGAGLNGAIIPLYIKEFAPLEILGKLESYHSLLLNGGILFVFISSMILPQEQTLVSGTTYIS